MSLTEEYNLTEYQVRSRLADSAVFEEQTIFEIRAVFRKKDSGKWNLWACSIEKTESLKNVWSQEYKENAFFIIYIEFKDIKSIMQSLHKEGILVDEKYPPITVASPSRWRETLIPSLFTKGSKPIRHFSSTIESNNYNDEPLVGHNLPYYSSFISRVNEFIAYENGETRCLHLLLEDDRAKLEKRGDKIKLTSKIEVSVVGEIKVNDKKKKIGPDGERLEDISIEGASLIELWVVGSNNLIFDYISTSALPYRYKSRLKEVTKEEYISKKIENGETLDCEFKKYINIDRTDSKSDEIDITVCAFSNTNGGDLVIGVSDYGEVIGVKNNVQKNYKKNLDDAICEYINSIKKRLYENLTINDCFTVDSFEIYGKKIIVINVRKVEKWNFLQATHIPYIRKGSTNYKAIHLVALDLDSVNRKVDSGYLF